MTTPDARWQHDDATYHAAAVAIRAADDEHHAENSDEWALRLARAAVDAVCGQMAAEMQHLRKQAETADRRFQEVCDRLDEEGNRALTHSRTLAAIRSAAQKWVNAAESDCDLVDHAAAVAGRAILRLLDGDQP